MAATHEGTTRLLDQLQTEMNRVMEQMGRVIVAANENPKTVPVVQANKLKEILPGSMINFHEALDQLEHELQLAKLVMRRDLATCRERSGAVKPTQSNGMPSNVEKQQDSSKAIMSASIDAEAKSDEDTTMQDVQPSQDTEMKDATIEEPAQDQKLSDTTNTDGNQENLSNEPSSQHDISENDPKPTDTALQVDTSAKPDPPTADATQDDDDQPPDTGTFTNDLDSLFGGPTSAGPVDGDFNNTEFDFGSFGGNGGENDDNITSLLPGLEDYANNRSPAHASDFDKIFDLDSVPIDPSQVQPDTTFDDLNFDDFTGGDYGGGEGGNNQNDGDGDFDFAFD